MSHLELKALDADCCLPFKIHSGQIPSQAMADPAALKEQLRDLCALTDLQRDREVQRLRSLAVKASAEVSAASVPGAGWL